MNFFKNLQGLEEKASPQLVGGGGGGGGGWKGTDIYCNSPIYRVDFALNLKPPDLN